MLRKPTVFIGSSSEGLKVAQALEAAFGQRAEVEAWNSGAIFQRHQDFLTSLLNTASLYEFAVLIFTKDDISVSRGKTYAAARDNVLFEFGLFLGKLGPRRAFTLVERDLKIPTDLLGITLDQFSRKKDGRPTAEFAGTADNIVSQIVTRHHNTTEFSHLPATALAIGYFHNFLSRVLDQLDDFEPVLVGRRRFDYSTFTLHVIVPDRLDVLDQDKFKKILRGLEPVTVKCRLREFPFYIKGIPAEGTTHLDLFDIPTTMRASRETICRVFREEYVGVNDLQVQAERREVSNFERTLQLLLNEHPRWQRYVKFVYLSDFL